MTDQQHEWERRAIIIIGGGLAYIVTIGILTLTFLAENEGERNLLIGGLLSSPVFGAAALFALLGIASSRQTGARNTINAGERGTVNVNEDTPTPPDAPTPPGITVIPASAVAGPIGANVGPVAATPVQSTSRGLQGQHVDRGPVPTFQPHNAEGGADQRGAPGA